MKKQSENNKPTISKQEVIQYLTKLKIEQDKVANFQKRILLERGEPIVPGQEHEFSVASHFIQSTIDIVKSLGK